jgi:hypothetical protein
MSQFESTISTRRFSGYRQFFMDCDGELHARRLLYVMGTSKNGLFGMMLGV